MSIDIKKMLHEHRKMWNWVAENKKPKEDWEGWSDYKEDEILNSCFICYICHNIDELGCDEDCILDWGEDMGCMDGIVEFRNPGLIRKYHTAIENNNWDLVAEYAREIASLPVKEQYKGILK